MPRMLRLTEEQLAERRRKGFAAAPKPQTKYRNQRVKTDEGTFDSKREYARWLHLKALQAGGAISDLKHHPKFPVVVSGVHICDYEADFTYVRRGATEHTVEDSKGVRTDVYKLKKKLVEAIYGFEILET